MTEPAPSESNAADKRSVDAVEQVLADAATWDHSTLLANYRGQCENVLRLSDENRDLRDDLHVERSLFTRHNCVTERTPEGFVLSAELEDWEVLELSQESGRWLRRLEVPGGWLVQNHLGALVFVPDAEHRWQIQEVTYDATPDDDEVREADPAPGFGDLETLLPDQVEG